MNCGTSGTSGTGETNGKVGLVGGMRRLGGRAAPAIVGQGENCEL